MNNRVKSVRKSKLTPELLKQLSDVLDKARRDPFLIGAHGITDDDPVIAIVMDSDRVIGLYSPETTSMSGKRYWRSGPVYMLPAFRGNRFMESILSDFFQTHRPGICWISDRNSSSRALYKKLGFKQFKSKDLDGDPGHWYTLSS